MLRGRIGIGLGCEARPLTINRDLTRPLFRTRVEQIDKGGSGPRWNATGVPAHRDQGSGERRGTDGPAALHRRPPRR